MTWESYGQLMDAKGEIERLQADLREAREIIKEVEWVGEVPNPSGAYCQICNRYRFHGHAPDCRLKKWMERQG